MGASPLADSRPSGQRDLAASTSEGAMLRPPGVGFVSLHEVRVQFEVLLSRANPDLFSIYWDLPSPRSKPLLPK